MTGEEDEVETVQVHANIIGGNTQGFVMQVGHIAGDVVLNARESTENDQG